MHKTPFRPFVICIDTIKQKHSVVSVNDNLMVVPNYDNNVSLLHVHSNTSHLQIILILSDENILFSVSVYGSTFQIIL